MAGKHGRPVRLTPRGEKAVALAVLLLVVAMLALVASCGISLDETTLPK